MLEQVTPKPNQDKLQDTIAVNNASFTVESGESFVIMGLSGSSKSI